MAAPTCNSEATPAKDAGNASFSAGRYAEAYDYYSEAILKDPASALLRSNRAGALAALGRHAEALADGDMCIAVRPDWWKGYTRRGHSLFQMQRYEESEVAFRQAQLLNPEEKTIAEALQRASQRKAISGSNIGGVNAGPREAANATSAANPAAPGFETSTPVVDFQRMSEQEIRWALERGLQKLTDEQLNAELVRAGYTPPAGASRDDKIKILLKKPGEDISGKKTTPGKKPPSKVLTWIRNKLSDGPSRGDKLLKQRQKWLEEWNSWDDTRLLQRLLKLGIDAEGNPRPILIDLLLEAETERYVKQRCTPKRLQFVGMLSAGGTVVLTFIVVVAIFATRR